MADAKSTHQAARALVERYGDAARREAARRETDAREAGRTDEAEDWRRVRGVLSEFAGARST